MPSSAAWVDAQQALRQSMLEEWRVRWTPARDLTAQLLLRLDDPKRSWGAAAEWLCGHLGADRVDGGPHTSLDEHYVPWVEMRREAHVLPSALNSSFIPRAAGDAATWCDPRPTFFQDVSTDQRLGESTRGELSRLGTRSKLVLPVVQESRVLGIFCADWRERHTPQANLAALSDVSSTVLGPLLSIAQTLQQPGPDAVPPALEGLTMAERRVAQLIAHGLSYKEVARHLDRSFSTVDHQLRSIRAKLGVASTARLSVLLARLWPQQ